MLNKKKSNAMTIHISNKKIKIDYLKKLFFKNVIKVNAKNKSVARIRNINKNIFSYSKISKFLYLKKKKKKIRKFINFHIKGINTLLIKKYLFKLQTIYIRKQKIRKYLNKFCRKNKYYKTFIFKKKRNNYLVKYKKLQNIIKRLRKPKINKLKKKSVNKRLLSKKNI